MPTIFQAQYATKEIMEDAASVDKVYEYMDNELIQYIDATDNMQWNI